MLSSIRYSLSVLFFSLITFASTLAHAQIFEEGEHYKRLDSDRSFTVKSQPEVIEFFYYGCPHCNNIRPFLAEWKKRKPSNVNFVLIPAHFTKRWEWSAYLNAVAKQLGVEDKVHNQIFDKHHFDGGIRSQKDIYNIFATAGISEEQVNDAYASFAAKNWVAKSREYSSQAGISGTPSYMVNGKYTVSPTDLNSFAEVFEVIDFLLTLDSSS